MGGTLAQERGAEENPPRCGLHGQVAAACVRTEEVRPLKEKEKDSRGDDGGAEVCGGAVGGGGRAGVRRAGDLQRRGGRGGVDGGELAGKKKKKMWRPLLRTS